MSKKKVSVQLDEGTVNVLDRVAKSQRKSRSWLIRRLLDTAARASGQERSDNKGR